MGVGVSRFLNQASNAARAHSEPPENTRMRENKIRTLEMIKLVAIVVGVVNFVFFALFPSYFAFLTALLGGYVNYEIFRVSQNFQEILENPVDRQIAFLLKENFIRAVAQKAPIANSLLKIFLTEQRWTSWKPLFSENLN